MTSKEALESLRQEYFVENDEHIIVFNADDERLDIIEKDLEILELIKSHCKNAIFMKALEYHVYRFVETDKEIYNIGRIEPFSKEEIEQLKRWLNGKD